MEIQEEWKGIVIGVHKTFPVFGSISTMSTETCVEQEVI